MSGWTLYPPSAEDLPQRPVADWRNSVERRAQIRAVREDIAALASQELTEVRIGRYSVALEFRSIRIRVGINKAFHFRLLDGASGYFVAYAIEHDTAVESTNFAFLVGKMCHGAFLFSRGLLLDFESRAAIWVTFEDRDWEPLEFWGFTDSKDNGGLAFFHFL